MARLGDYPGCDRPADTWRRLSRGLLSAWLGRDGDKAGRSASAAVSDSARLATASGRCTRATTAARGSAARADYVGPGADRRYGRRSQLSLRGWPGLDGISYATSDKARRACAAILGGRSVRGRPEFPE